MLEGIVFICGAALMGLEFVAARMLAPSLGSSLFVWGSVVSIVMVALSLGYWLGGQIADRFGSTRTLSPVVAGAGLFTVVIPSLTAAVLPLVADLGARTGSLAASAVVFFVPALLLAMVSPLGVRLATGGDVARVGRSAGQLSAISTAGSILGTIATAFWLIPLMSLDGLVIGIGLLLFATAGACLVLPRRYADPDTASHLDSSGATQPAVVTAVCIALGLTIAAITLFGGPSNQAIADTGERVIYRKDTQYHRLLVTEDDTQRHLRFDRSHQSAMYFADPFDSSFVYPKYLHLALAVKPDARKVLVMGLGGGTLVKRMWRDYPQMQIDAAEIDPIVVDVAYDYFDLPKDPRVTVAAEDGRRFIQATEKTYDIIVVDAYYADALPSHLTTTEFFEELKAHLSPTGVIAYNVIGSIEGDRSRLSRSMYRTVGGVFDDVWVFPIGIGTDRLRESNRNIIVLATDARLTENELRRRISSRVGNRVGITGFETFGRDLYTEPIRTDDVPVLTDAHAPTDSLIEVN